MTPAEYKKLPKRLSPGEESLAMQLKAEKISFQREFKFHPLRKWRFDFVLDVMHGNIAVEAEGGSWINGAHNRGSHFASDCEKYSEAAIMGWRVMRFTTDQIISGYAIDCIKRAIS